MPPSPPAHLTALFRHYDSILNSIPIGQVFDSHWFIQNLTRDHQAEYIIALTHYTRGPGPFKKLHRLLANELNRKAQVRNTRRRPQSTDIFGDRVSNAEWKRV